MEGNTINVAATILKEYFHCNTPHTLLQEHPKLSLLINRITKQ